MRIILIHGQNHMGSTYHMGRLLAEKLAQKADIAEYFLPRDLPHFCLGCYSCIDDETKCPYSDEKKRILDDMEKADLFIFTSPNYCMAPSGAMKSFLDLFFNCWMVHKPKKWMFEKKAVVLAASAGASCKKTIRTIKDSLFYWGVPCIMSYGAAVQAKNWDEVNQDKKTKIEKDISRIAQRLKSVGRPKVGIKTRLIFFVMKNMHAAGMDSSPTEKAYWQSQGWLSKGRPWKK